MWNVEILDKGTDKDRIAVQVQFTKAGEEALTVNFTARTAAELNQTIKNYQDNLASRDADLDTVTVGAWTAPVEEAPEAPTQTEDEIAEATWNTAKGQLEQALELKRMAIEAGRPVSPERQADIDALAAFVDANFKSEYVN